MEARSDVLSLQGDLKPDMGSLTLSSLNFNRTTSVNEPSMIVSLAEVMKENGIRPELEAFDLGMVNYCNYLIKKGAVVAPYYVNLILGNIACAQGDLLHIGCMLKDIPEDSIFSLGAVGTDQFKMNSLGITMGWGVRVGLEDNFWYDENRTKLATNMDLLMRIHKVISANEKEVMTSKELRQKLNLEPGFGKYGVAGSNV
ncbi:3-keto-5-aminohexanoate cleavage enzyme [bioreactor metagenome]|uniref:3-keto-5-aminohexanoate cleavage enzyme n=1 Tax=bioreactor metagenome TaxID=1076179 RepID=A0A645F581_9ZZZZ